MAGTYALFCNAEVLQCEGAGMRRCWNADVLECGGAGMRRCWNAEVLESPFTVNSVAILQTVALKIVVLKTVVLKTARGLPTPSNAEPLQARQTAIRYP